MNRSSTFVCRTVVAGAFAMALSMSAGAQTGEPATAPTTPPPSTQPAADLPKAEDLLKDAMQAMGGTDAFDKIESSYVKATMTTPMGELDLEMYNAKPDKFLIKQSSPMGDGSMGSNGELAWRHAPMMGGYALMTPEEAAEAREQAFAYRIVLNMTEDYSSMETVDKTEFEGEQCYKVRLVPKDGQGEGMAYFDVDEKYIRGLEMTQETPMGAMTTTIAFSNWKKIDDVTVYTKMDIQQMGMAASMNFDTVEFNKVDPAVFEAPAEVKELAAKGPATQPDTQPSTAPHDHSDHDHSDHSHD